MQRWRGKGRVEGEEDGWKVKKTHGRKGISSKNEGKG